MAQAPASPVPHESLPAPSGEVTWPQFMEILQQKLPFIFGLFSKGRADTSAQDRILVTLDACSAFEKKRLENKNKALQQLSKAYFGKFVDVNIKAQASVSKGPSESQKAEERAKQEASHHPMVQEARRLFDGEIL